MTEPSNRLVSAGLRRSWMKNQGEFKHTSRWLQSISAPLPASCTHSIAAWYTDMTADRNVRRLCAILAADVAGYSQLMGADEDGTLFALMAHRRELIDPAVAEHLGRIVKTTGDGLLVEFASVVDAMRCAVDIQRGMAERNHAVPEH